MAPILGIFASKYTPLGSFESIATVSLSSDTSTITFSSIPNTFKHLQLRVITKSSNPNAGSNPRIKVNTDTGGNYTFHQLYTDGSTIISNGGTNDTAISIVSASGTNDTNVFSAGITDILDYANTNKYKTFRTLGGMDKNGSGFINFRSSVWMSTSAIDTLTITVDGGYTFKTYSHFALYGIK